MNKKRSFLNGPKMYPKLSVERSGYKTTKGAAPGKFLGGLVNKIAGRETKLGGAMQGKGVAGAFMNPLGAIKNKLMG
tara:strand:+ start:345 stop:575 length:231 start_codon:yes stop_codon:yes gene_type:complete